MPTGLTVGVGPEAAAAPAGLELGAGRGRAEHMEPRQAGGLGGWAGEPRVCRIHGRARPGLSCRPRSAAVNAGMGPPPGLGPPPRVADQCQTRRSVFLNPDAEGATQHLLVAGLRAFGCGFPKVKVAVYFFQIGQHNS